MNQNKLKFTTIMDKCFLIITMTLAVCSTSGVYGIRFKDCGSILTTVGDCGFSSCSGSSIEWPSIAGSSLATANAAFVQGCENLDTCLLHKGVNITFGVDFTPKSNNGNLKMLVYGHIAGIDVPFPIDNPDACKNSNISCPVESGKAYSYRNVIFVKTEYPSISVIVKLKLVNQSSDVLVCVVIPVQIVSSQSNSVLRFLPRQ